MNLRETSLSFQQEDGIVLLGEQQETWSDLMGDYELRSI